MLQNDKWTLYLEVSTTSCFACKSVPSWRAQMKCQSCKICLRPLNQLLGNNLGSCSATAAMERKLWIRSGWWVCIAPQSWHLNCCLFKINENKCSVTHLLLLFLPALPNRDTSPYTCIYSSYYISRRRKKKKSLYPSFISPPFFPSSSLSYYLQTRRGRIVYDMCLTVYVAESYHIKIIEVEKGGSLQNLFIID